MKATLFRAALLAASIPLLSGCVAALVPVIASGTLLGKEQLESNDEDEREGVVAIDDSAVPEPGREPATLAEPVPAPATAVNEQPTEAEVAELAAADLPASQLPTFNEQFSEIERPSADFVGPVDTEQGETKLATVASVDTAPAASPAPAIASVEAEPPTTEPAQLATATPPATPLASIERVAEPELPAAEPAQVALVTAPPPAPVTRPSTTVPGPTDFRAYDALYSYVESQARRDPVKSPRQSALLAAPGSLSPVRTECSIRPPAILVDLDPADRPFDASITPQANPSLGQILTSFRLQEIEIFWISQQSAISAGAIRKALVASGLDLQGRDGLLLMRSGDDRKQARRKELSETHCLLAIGGDTRADFDELYLYLKEETAAQPLEELIGAGWFLTPLPLTEGQ